MLQLVASQLTSHIQIDTLSKAIEENICWASHKAVSKPSCRNFENKEFYEKKPSGMLRLGNCSSTWDFEQKRIFERNCRVPADKGERNILKAAPEREKQQWNVRLILDLSGSAKDLKWETSAGNIVPCERNNKHALSAEAIIKDESASVGSFLVLKIAEGKMKPSLRKWFAF